MKKLKMFLAVWLVLAFATTAYAERSVDDAVSWAENQIGSMQWYIAPHNYCLKFTANAYGNAHSNFEDAWTAWEDNGSTFGNRKTSNNFNDIPKGALVFFKTSIHPNGHVGLCAGSGKMIHAWTDGVRKENISNYSSHYAGWRWPGAWVITDFSDDSNPVFINLRTVGVIGWYPVNKTCINAERWYRIENGRAIQSFGDNSACYKVGLDYVTNPLYQDVLFGTGDLPLQCTE